MSFRALAPWCLLALVATTGCSKADVSMQNDLKGTQPVVVGRAGGSDDSIKPKTLTPAPVVAKGGGVDDSIKPKGPAPLPVPALGGIPDDSIKPKSPAPRP